MMTDFLRRVERSAQEEHNRYAGLNFSRNPFPTRPSVTPGSSDDRENGSIYVPQLRQKEEVTFEKLLVPSAENPQTRSIAFLMDFATRRGRGIGKTAFLHYQKNRIMKDLGNQLSGGDEVIFAVYVFPRPDGRTRKFWQFHKLLIKALVEQEILATAMCRLRAFSGIIPQDILEKVGEDLQQTLGNDEWLMQQNINVMNDFMGKKGLNDEVYRKLISIGIDPKPAQMLSRFGHDVGAFEGDIENISDRGWSNDNGNMFFNDMVKVLKEAGFTKGLILLDEVEKIIAPQNSTERRAFTDSLRYFFMDGYCENVRQSFCSLLLTIHPYVQELLSPHWNATGLDRFAALSGELASDYTIYFEPLNQAFAIPLAQAYLNASRTNVSYNNLLEPFESDAITEALVLSGRVPGLFLTLLNNTVEKAVSEGIETINGEFIRDVAKIKEPQEPSRDDKAKHLTQTQVDLKKDE
jgi:hypothetical protein